MLVYGFLCGISPLFAQDSVDVVFRYQPTVSATRVYVPGEFNAWANNSGGVISPTNTNAAMTFDEATQSWKRAIRLRIGGSGGKVAGAYQYKFNIDGSSTGWVNDPLNVRYNTSDNSNSVIAIKDPTIYHIIPNQRQLTVKTNTPVISSYLFPKVGTSIDTSTIILTIDGQHYGGLGKYFDSTDNFLSLTCPVSLSNGSHSMAIAAGTLAGGMNIDSVTFTIQAGFIQITSHGGYETYSPVKLIRGIVQDTAIHSVKMVKNSTDTIPVSAINGFFSVTDSLHEGVNTYRAIVDTGNTQLISDPFSITYHIDHNPYAVASVIADNGTQLELSAAASTHPDGKLMMYTWMDDSLSPLGLNGTSGENVSVTKPSTPGEYYFTLIAKDSSGGADTTRSYFIISKNGSYQNPTYASNPQWAKQARVYFLFPKSFTPQGTLAAATARLQYVRNMGFNVVWVMPVMKNAQPIDQHYGPGYNIIDFYHVAPEYGTDQDFKNFVLTAHSVGLKVILDVTPNHTSRFHPWSVDAHMYKQDSRYWTWYEHSIIPHNDNGLGQSLDADGFNYYSGFSDQLLNFNWKDTDARHEMINVYTYWIKKFHLDGYRFDVYWGPHRRYGEQYMGMPVRTALKHIKPDILLLAEDDGTGSGTETIYADYANGDLRGGVDAAYDFSTYFNQIRNFGFTAPAITNLHNALANAGYYPGPNALYMRFMQSQDEDAISYFYSSNGAYDTVTALKRTMPMATVIFSAPGFPMVWNGQEIGYGYGINGSKEDRVRSTINWKFPGYFLQKHYQRLAWIRGSFPAFATQSFNRIGTGNSLVYGIVRPYTNDNALSLSSFANVQTSVTLSLTISGSSPNLLFSDPQDGKTYYINDVYNDTTYEVTFTNGSADFVTQLPAYGTAIYIVSDTIRSMTLPAITSVQDDNIGGVPTEYSLSQNYPNPFNPTTTIRYQLPVQGRVTLKIYDMLGRIVATLVDGNQNAGSHSIVWDASHEASGVYFYRLSTSNFVKTKKMIVIR